MLTPQPKSVCPYCQGKGNVLAELKLVAGMQQEKGSMVTVVCPKCHGTGWTAGYRTK
jgi:DnaJ-class molecular chaperone